MINVGGLVWTTRRACIRSGLRAATATMLIMTSTTLGANAAPEPEKQSDPHAGSKFTPLDLRPAANVDPMAKEDPFGLGPEPAPRPYLWVEAESLNKQDGSFGPEARAAASNGQVLGKGFGAKPGQWAEWYFDLPFQTEKGELYLRAARTQKNPSATLQVALDGRNVCTFFLPLTGGPGDQEKDFGLELARANLGHIEMGRHVLRITASKEGDEVNLDGFWLSDDQQDFLNRVDTQRRVPPPARPHMLVYPFGPIRIRGIDYLLLDPATNAGKGIFYSGAGQPAVVPCRGMRGEQLHVLGAGVVEKADVELSAVFEDGTTHSETVHLGTLFAQKPENPVARFGLARFGYCVSLTLPSKPIREIRLGKGTSPYVIVAITLETRPATAR